MAFQLAIDGPVASGKSTISKLLAKKLNWTHIDTGSLYRTVAFASQQLKVDENDQKAFKFIKNLKIKLQDEKIFLDGKDISKAIRTHEMSRLASKISTYPLVRELLFDLQVKLSKSGNVVMDGRDIGTVIMPHADLKIFLNADPHERAKRRYLEDSSKSLAEIEKDLIARDYQDSHRKIAPLKKADDAIEVDTTNLSIVEVVDKIISIINKKGDIKNE